MPSSTTEARDIYDLLGISPEASPKMAQAMYWARIRELREAERAGEPNARDEIEQLNDALQIISDDSRRVAYNRGEELPEPGTTATSGATPIPARRGKRSPRAVAVGAGIFAASMVALFATDAAGMELLARPVPPLIFILVIGTLGAGLVGAGLQRRLLRTPFDVLELAPGATPEDIDFAYRTLASSWLAQLRNAPDLALESLEQLDRAYTLAMAPHVDSLSRGGGANLAQAVRGLAAWLRGRDWQQVAGGAVAVTGRLVAGTARVVSWGVTSMIAVYRGEEVARFGQEEHEAPEIQLDLQRRLSASVHVLAQEGLEQPRETGQVSTAGGLYEIVLETPVGARRVGLGERPLRIGSAADADIAVELVDEADGNEQVLLWVNGEDLVLHATAGATCTVNGTPSTWARLEVGDAITIGATMLQVQRAQRVEPAA
ncbi:MAG: hypothetical protein GEU80_12790 [Dehalococcoidia bacterium]|nr:hypothetical protein [Dehalococcoidia bacterium]